MSLLCGMQRSRISKNGRSQYAVIEGGSTFSARTFNDRRPGSPEISQAIRLPLSLRLRVWTLSQGPFTRMIHWNADPWLLHFDCSNCDEFDSRRTCGRTAGPGCGQGARPHGSSFVGALVLELSGGTEKRWLVENGEGKPEDQIHFCFRLEQWQRRSCHAGEIRPNQSGECYHYG